jgi:predicted TIM-barrel fold metal-dependent hydrolase
MGNKLILVSADGHASARPQEYRPYMDKLALDHYDEYLVDAERYVRAMSVFTKADGHQGVDSYDLVDKDGAIRSGGFDGTWDLDRRLVEMDREGVAVEVLLHGPTHAMAPFFTPSSRRNTYDLRAAGLRAYHRWAADFGARSKGRLIPMADTAGDDMAAMVAELEWCVAHGFGAVHMPGLCAEPQLPPLFDSFYEPFWALCAEAGLVVVIHAGWGIAAHGQFIDYFEKIMEMSGGDRRKMGMMAPPGAVGLKPGQAMWQLMAGGVFDRHPRLKLLLNEVRADWAPATLKVFDERFDAGGTPLKMKPSEYYRRHVYVSPSSPRPTEVAMRHEIGLDRFLFGRDYPHPEGTWPNTADWIRATFAGVPEDEVRLILGENAIECFGLDRGMLTRLADRIGFTPQDVLGGHHQVDPALLDHFDVRAGYKQPVSEPDPATLTRTIDADLAQLAGVA